MSIFTSKAAKKKAQAKKNRYHQMIYEFVRLRREEDQKLKTIEKTHQEKKRYDESHGTNDEVWSAKVQTIRNRLTDQKRSSKERWNRFAGTGDEGGRGL